MRCVLRGSSIFIVSAKFFIDYNSRLMHFSITKIPRTIWLWLFHSPCSLFHYRFTTSCVIEGFSFLFFFNLVFDITTYLTTIHQTEKMIKNKYKNKNKKKKMSCHWGKPKPFFLIHLINLQISQKVDHLSKK